MQVGGGYRIPHHHRGQDANLDLEWHVAVKPAIMYWPGSHRVGFETGFDMAMVHNCKRNLIESHVAGPFPKIAFILYFWAEQKFWFFGRVVKALLLGSSSNEHGFESHRDHQNF